MRIPFDMSNVLEEVKPHREVVGGRQTMLSLYMSTYLMFVKSLRQRQRTKQF
jgi:hypothetical protein